jgi:excisionase family DNA binding protein
MAHLPYDLRFAEEFLDIHAVAARLGVRVGHVRALVAKRQIPVVRVGRLLRFDWAEVRQWLERTASDVEEIAAGPDDAPAPAALVAPGAQVTSAGIEALIRTTAAPGAHPIVLVATKATHEPPARRTR